VNIIHILLITSFIDKISVSLGLKVPGLVHVTESDEKNPPKITSSFIHQHFRVFFYIPETKKDESHSDYVN